MLGSMIPTIKLNSIIFGLKPYSMAKVSTCNDISAPNHNSFLSMRGL